MKTKFVVTHVQTQGFNDHQVSLENESADIKIRLKDQADFNKFAKGQEVDLSFIEAPKKASTKKK